MRSWVNGMIATYFGKVETSSKCQKVRTIRSARSPGLRTRDCTRRRRRSWRWTSCDSRSPKKIWTWNLLFMNFIPMYFLFENPYKSLHTPDKKNQGATTHISRNIVCSNCIWKRAFQIYIQTNIHGSGFVCLHLYEYVAAPLIMMVPTPWRKIMYYHHHLCGDWWCGKVMAHN
jgi:hypothetical protein